MTDQVQLTDLDVIARYSLAVRTADADRDELVAVLEADLAWLRGARRSGAGATARKSAAPARGGARSRRA